MAKGDAPRGRVFSVDHGRHDVFGFHVALGNRVRVSRRIAWEVERGCKKYVIGCHAVRVFEPQPL